MARPPAVKVQGARPSEQGATSRAVRGQLSASKPDRASWTRLPRPAGRGRGCRSGVGWPALGRGRQEVWALDGPAGRSLRGPGDGAGTGVGGGHRAWPQRRPVGRVLRRALGRRPARWARAPRPLRHPCPFWASGLSVPRKGWTRASRGRPTSMPGTLPVSSSPVGSRVPCGRGIGCGKATAR